MLKYLWFVLLLPNSILPTTTDRPYKFAFDIQGYQHRMEEKDEKGIIKGEYGFITADGYYRITVYATDEDGKFHILSMKNIYVGFPPDDPVTTTISPKQHQGNQRQPQTFGSGAPNAGGQNEINRGRDRATESPKTFTRPQGIAGCSDCFIPTQPPPSSAQGGFNSGVPGGGSSGSLFGGGRGRPGQPPQSSQIGNIERPKAQQLPQREKQERGPVRGYEGGFAGGPARGPAIGSVGGPARGPAISPARGPSRGSERGPAGGHAPQGSPPFSGNIRPSFEEGNQLGPNSGVNKGVGPSRGRTDFTQNNQLGDILHQRPQIGQVRDGLPPGVSMKDISDLLYTFNYTVGNAAHHEDGYRNGDKIGDYYFVTRKGIKQDVEYVANEFGYQPNITFTNVNKNDGKPYEPADDNELKGYEFKWFYRK